MELTAFLASVMLISLSGVMAPGPLFAATIAEGRRNMFAGFIISAGHAIVEVPIILALFLFGLAIATETVKAVVGILGGIVLFYLAFLEIKNYGSINEGKPGKSLITGIAMSALNPYFIIWWLTIGFALVMQSAEFSTIGLILFVMVHEACDFLWLGFISITSNKTAKLWGAKAYKTLTVVSVSIFIVFGVYFLMTGILTLVSTT